jgi:hypothetical protein
VVSLDRSKDWKIYYRDYVKSKSEYFYEDIITPYRWSKDGRFLYAVAWSRQLGCCWLGGQYILLVRLNLETGDQVALLNDTNYDNLKLTFQISNSERYLLFTTHWWHPYDLVVLDLQTWKTRTIPLKHEGELDVNYALMSPNEGQIILPLFKQLEFNDYRVHALLLFDLATGHQRLLISGLKPDAELYPVRFEDAQTVLLSSKKPDDSYDQQTATSWLLDLNSGELRKGDAP